MRRPDRVRVQLEQPPVPEVPRLRFGRNKVPRAGHLGEVEVLRLRLRDDQRQSRRVAERRGERNPRNRPKVSWILLVETRPNGMTTSSQCRLWLERE